MGRWSLILLCITCLGLPIVAQENSSDFFVYTFPPGADILDYGAKYLGKTAAPGKTDNPVTLTSGVHTLTLRLANHEDKSVTLGGKDIGVGRYPDTGVLVLRPLTTRQTFENWWRYRRGHLAAGFLAVSAGAAWLAWQRRDG